MGTLDGQLALVTGGGRGIGKEVAQTLASEGANVAVSARTAAEIEAVAEEVRGKGVRALAVTCDISNREQVNAMVETVSGELGSIDILVNNAGASGSHKFLGHDDDLWHRMLDINLTGTYYVTRAVAPIMAERKSGRIINIASVAGKVGAPYIAAYAAAKHGVLGLTRAVALELASLNITVNAICPGYVNTPMTDQNIANIVARTKLNEEEARQTIEKMSPQRRLIEVDEVAALVLMLTQNDARGITGQAISVDGGSLMS